MGFDLPTLVHILRRWWWLLILAPLIGGGAMYLYGKSQQPMYRATAVLWVQMAPGSDGPDPSVIQGDINLAEMYRYLVTVEPVLAPVIDDLQLPYDVDDLRDRIVVTVVRNTPLLEIAASDANPSRAAAIANAVTRHFGDGIGQLGVQDGTSLAATGASAGTNLAVRVVPAEVPPQPYAPRMPLFVLLGAALGLLVTVGLAGIVEYRRQNYRTSVNSEARVQDPPLPLLAPGTDVGTAQ